MTSRSSPPPSDDALREQCAAYLLGELDAQQAVAFEQRLADARVAELLLAESRLIGQLAAEPAWPKPDTVAPRTPCPAPPCPVPPCPVPPSLAEHTASPASQSAGFGVLATLLVTIAAVVLVAALLSRREERSHTGSLHASRSQPAALQWQLTDALVEPAIEWSDPGETIESGGVDEDGQWDDLASAGGEDTATEESLSWLVVAVKAAGLPEDGLRKDGLPEGNGDG